MKDSYFENNFSKKSHSTLYYQIMYGSVCITYSISALLRYKLYSYAANVFFSSINLVTKEDVPGQKLRLSTPYSYKVTPKAITSIGCRMTFFG